MLSLYTESDPDLLMKCISDHEDSLYLLFLSIHNRFLAEKTQQTNKLHAKVEKRLTSREIEALHWASIGKTYREIAIIMGITESTVKFHIGNLIVKLDVINAKHAIKKRRTCTYLISMSSYLITLSMAQEIAWWSIFFLA
ncbi:hypothetical protein SODG_005812 [Sodalis praecaptivus]